MNILIDSSVWIDYFRGGAKSNVMDDLIDENLVCTNDLILAELLPAILHQGQSDLAALLKVVAKIPLEINWDNIIQYQTLCLSRGINKVGIPDLIIVDNVIQNDMLLFSLDKHFDLIRKHLGLKIFDVE